MEDLRGRVIGRFALREQLGAGAMGSVYLAEDREFSGRFVALKFLRGDLLEGVGAQRALRAEVGALARMNHAYITAFFDMYEEEGYTFVSMEYVDGETLAEHLKGGRLALDFLLTVAGQVAEALVHAHGRNIIHRDIKPANIKVAAGGYAKLMDFGLAALVFDGDGESTVQTESGAVQPVEPAIAGEGLVLGTPSYMSPEQTRGWVVDARSDIFSFGVMLHEMASGQRPFASATRGGLFKVIREQPQPSLSGSQLGLPDSLLELIRCCLEKEPRERPQTMLEVLERLRAVGGTLVASPRMGGGQPIPLPTFASDRRATSVVPLVGRARERQQIEELLGRAEAGTGSILLIQGEAGIGKSRLVEHLLQRAGERSGLAGTGACILRGNAPPFHAFIEAASGLMERAGLRTTEDLDAMLEAFDCPPQRVSAIHCFLGLAEGSSLSPDQLLAGASELFLALARRAGRLLAVVIEDLNQADDASVDLFCFLAHRLAGTRLILAGTFRAGSLLASSSAQGQAHERVVDQLAGRPDLLKVTLDRLSPEEITELTAGVLPGLELDQPLQETLQASSGGNPLFVLEYLEHLRREDCIVRAGGVFRRTKALDSAAVPRRIQELLERRLDRLDASLREVLELAAVDGNLLDPALLAGALDLSRLGLLRTVRLLHAEHRLVMSSEKGFRLDPPQMREVILGRLAPPLRQEMHLLLATSMVRLYGDDDQRAGRIARHWIGAGERLEAVGYLRRAGKAALAVHALSGAHRHYSRAFGFLVEAAPEDPRRWPLLRELVEVKGKVGEDRSAIALLKREMAECASFSVDDKVWALVAMGASHVRLGAYARALALLEKAEKTGEDGQGIPGEIRIELLRTRAGALIRAADFDSALECLGEADRLTSSGSARALAIAYRTGHALYAKGDYPAARIQWKKVVEDSRTAGELRQMTLGLYALSSLERMAGLLPEARRLGEEAVGLAEKTGDRRGLSHATNNLALALIALGDRERGIDLHERSLELKRELGDLQGESNSLHNLAEACRQGGRLKEAIAHAERAAAIKRNIGELDGLMPVLLGRGTLLAELGRTLEARESFQEVREVSQARGQADWAVRALVEEARIDLAHEQLESARQRLRDAVAGSRERQMPVSEINAWQLLLRVEARAGDKDALAAAAAEAEKAAGRLDNRQTVVVVGEARALVAWSEGRLAEARKFFEDVLDWLEKEEWVDQQRAILAALESLAASSGGETSSRWAGGETSSRWAGGLARLEAALSRQFADGEERETFLQAPLAAPVWKKTGAAGL